MESSNKLFYGGLIFSVLIHTAAVSYLSISKINALPKVSKPLEVTYQHTFKAQKISQNEASSQELELVKKKPLVKPNVKVLSKKHDIFSSVGKNIRDISKFTRNLKLDRKQTPDITPLEMERKISVPMLKSEKITNPKYLSYNQTIRQKIRQRAYSYINHVDFEAGNVYLTFIISSDGALKEIKVIEKRTSANDYLRKAGARSIKESSPFPAFPKDLEYPELTFNVVISFEVKE